MANTFIRFLRNLNTNLDVQAALSSSNYILKQGEPLVINSSYYYYLNNTNQHSFKFFIQQNNQNVQRPEFIGPYYGGHGIEVINDTTEHELGCINLDAQLSDLGDVNVTSPTDGDVLYYSNSGWINHPLSNSAICTLRGSTGFVLGGYGENGSDDPSYDITVTDDITPAKLNLAANTKLQYYENVVNGRTRNRLIVGNDTTDYSQLALKIKTRYHVIGSQGENADLSMLTCDDFATLSGSITSIDTFYHQLPTLGGLLLQHTMLTPTSVNYNAPLIASNKATYVPVVYSTHSSAGNLGSDNPSKLAVPITNATIANSIQTKSSLIADTTNNDVGINNVEKFFRDNVLSTYLVNTNLTFLLASGVASDYANINNSYTALIFQDSCATALQTLQEDTFTLSLPYVRNTDTSSESIHRLAISNDTGIDLTFTLDFAAKPTNVYGSRVIVVKTDTTVEVVIKMLSNNDAVVTRSWSEDNITELGREVYWCYWDDNNSTVTGLTPAEIYQLTMDGCVVKCMYAESESYVFDLMRVAWVTANTYEVVFVSPVDISSAYINEDLIVGYVDGTWEYISNEFILVQSDWNQTNTTASDYIKNKPTVPTLRTMNHEQLTDNTLGDINIHDGYYFPNAVQDYDGNWYGAVVIGDQVWMAENLKTTHYADGTSIAEHVENTLWIADYMFPGGTESNKEKYGLLYNWVAVMNGETSSSSIPSNVQGISPNGWHIPSDAEFHKLTDYVTSQQRYCLGQNGNGYKYIAKSLAATEDWNTSNVNNYVPGKNPESNNTTGFNARPSGVNGEAIGNRVFFHTSTGTSPNTISMEIINVLEYITYLSNNQNSHNSVRCVSDLTPVQFRNWYVETYGTMQHQLTDSLQPTLVSGTNIKTVNNQSILGSGDLTVTPKQTASKLNISSSSFSMTYGSASSQTILLQIQDGVSNVSMTLDQDQLDKPNRIIVDNSGNTGDTYLTFTIKYNNVLVQKEIIAPALNAAGGYLLKAGDAMELEHTSWNISGNYTGCLGLIFGSV